MLLSELMQAPESEALCFGVEVDTDLLSPPSGLQQVGLIYQGTSTELSDVFLDAIVACTLAGIDTIIEIPSNMDVDPAEMMKICGNTGVSLSILPPHTQADLDAWAKRCAAFAQSYLDTPHFTGQLYPISGYFGHLVAQSVSGVQAHQPTDPYVRQRFVDAIPTTWSDHAKDAMKKAWEERAGGPAALQALFQSIAGAAVIETMDLIDRLTQPSPSSGAEPAGR